MNALYFAGSLAGVAAMVGLNLLLFGRARAVLDSQAVAVRLQEDMPDFHARGVTVSADKDCALAEGVDGAIFLVVVSGDKFVARKLVSGSLQAIARVGASLTIRFEDFTFPRARLTLVDETSARDWETRLKAMS
jgi:hypothetical protein